MIKAKQCEWQFTNLGTEGSYRTECKKVFYIRHDQRDKYKKCPNCGHKIEESK